MKIKKIPVDAQPVTGIGYHPKYKILRVWHKDGVHDFYDVPEPEFEQLKAESDIAAYLEAHIKGKYKQQEVRQQYRVLLVEDEENLQEAIKLNLELEGYEAIAVSSGSSAIEKFRGERFDLIILDVMLPEMSGFQICEKIRLEDKKTPILFLTARDSHRDKIEGLSLGADDYLTKPFNLEELLWRVRNLLKRSAKGEQAEQEKNDIFEFGSNKINFSTYEAETPKGKISLTKKEIQLLRLLIKNKNKPVSRQQILETVWEYDVYPSTRTIDNFILAFRKYFEKDPKNPQFFHSIRGVGYKFAEQ